jgi:hypothetical protein
VRHIDEMLSNRDSLSVPERAHTRAGSDRVGSAAGEVWECGVRTGPSRGAQPDGASRPARWAGTGDYLGLSALVDHVVQYLGRAPTTAPGPIGGVAKSWVPVPVGPAGRCSSWRAIARVCELCHEAQPQTMR